VPYSTQLWVVNNDLSAAPTVYTVPTGYVAVMRDVSITNQTGSAAVIQIGANVPGPLTVLVTQWDSVNDGDTVEWQGRAVFNPGDQIFVGVYSGYALTIGSGYLLSSP
jgi:hypothetical protein